MVYQWWAYDYTKLKFKPLPRRAGENGTLVYADAVCAFDIETTRLPDRDESVLYIWQLAINDDVIIGRTWDAFKAATYRIGLRLCGMKLVVFVHNLSYEMQFLSGIYHFHDYEVFCTEPRKILKATMYKNFEFRCSYRLTNLSLDALTRRYNTHYIKRSGVQFDYSKLRFWWTPLDKKELMYCVYDVLGLVESIREILKLNGDNLYSLPLTQTGFVRRDVKRDMRELRYELQNNYPSYRVYQLLKAAFRGGNTHANRYYAGEVIDGPVHSADISSSYPSQQCNKLFPITPFKERVSASWTYVLDKMDCGAAFILRVAFYNIRMKNKYSPVPYIPTAKCAYVIYPDDEDGVCVDNGRVLRAVRLEMCLTDIDFKIIEGMYAFDKAEILEMYSSWYGPLPEPLRNLNIEYFKKKTQLKGVDGQELFYMKNKEMLNSIYGMSVQDPVKLNILFANCQYKTDIRKTPEEIHANKGQNPYTEFQYGVWTTAHARYSLQCGIDLCGDNLLYVDTDSCKYTGDVDFSRYNEARVQECLKNGACAADRKGVVHYMGVYEAEPDMDAFITLGAKKYAYLGKWQSFRDVSTRIHITVSGVSKAAGARELALHGGLEAFKPGFVFENSGKTDSLFNDDDTRRLIYIDGKKVELTRNVVIRDTTYTLSVTGDYAQLLKMSADDLNKVHRFWRNTQLLK